ncbi:MULTISPECIES: hypothetical protein [Nostocales]|uniref:Uncharacterized protein n=3 Tax=Nostocales TaxID=1161 RepID=A0A0C1RJ14_9CYAN|nr:hypothetical protein [Tolypothrix bouteillei]KAF3884100.1 hypothetical protein DA73_0400000235 [Tolypothrix bouteillei VB521301]
MNKIARGVFTFLGILFSTLLLTFLSGEAAYASSTDTFCNPVQTLVFTTAPRLHVRCAESVGGIIYFALSTKDAAQAARVLSILSTAQVAGRTLVIGYDPDDLSGADIGCQTNDCRLIQAVGFNG